MEKTNQSQRETQDDIFELGVASVETKGATPPSNEGIGLSVGVGITE